MLIISEKIEQILNFHFYRQFIHSLSTLIKTLSLYFSITYKNIKISTLLTTTINNIF